MNPFVNPKKRSILLPSGCKDLADVLRLPARQTGDPIKLFIRELLLQAEEVGATEILISAPEVHEGECPITQRIAGRFYHVSTTPAGFRSGIVAELLRMSALPDSHFPARGLAILKLKRRQVKWHLRLETAEGECQLTPFEE
jgi:type II secretory ATPase GspE/PulE/Tfp pilus assembly ATPase PilB-like protein